MVRRSLRFFSAFFAFFLVAAFVFALGSRAFAADQVGTSCQTLGVSTMASDQKNLIVCLKDDAGNLVWKSMTSKPAGVPVGAIIAWPMATNPKDMQNADGSFNWLDCNGQAVPSSLYPDLYAAIGARVPDLRGLFLRGNGGASAALGVAQGYATYVPNATTNLTIQGLSQGYAATGDGGAKCGSGWSYPGWDISAGGETGWGFSGCDRLFYQVGGAQTFTATQTISTGATETRPPNMSVRYLIRARS